MLDQLQSGKRAKIRCHHANGAVRQRLLDLGFTPGSQIDVVRRAPLGDPIQCRIANTSVTLRSSEARLIEVEPEISNTHHSSSRSTFFTRLTRLFKRTTRNCSHLP